MFQPWPERRISWAALMLTTLALSFRAECVIAQTLGNAAAEVGVDSSIEPGDDFFGYANGEWLSATAIPPGQTKWSARNQITELTALQVAQVIREANSAGAAGRQVADFHAAYLDRRSIERKGLAPVLPMLNSIAGLRDKTALARWLGQHLQADVDPLNKGLYDSSHLFGLAASFGIHGERNYLAYLVQGGLGLIDREAYLANSAAALALRLAYRDYIAHILHSVGSDAAATRAEAVLALETAIALSHASAAASANDGNADNRWQRADFMQQAPGMNWPEFFAAARLTRQADIVVWQPDAIKGSAALVASQPLAVWQDYLRFHAVHRHAEVLPNSIAEAASRWQTAAMTAAGPAAATAATPAPAARDQRAIAATNDAVPEAVGQLYVRRYFPAASKARVEEVLHNVAAAFGRRVAAVPWMSAATKQVALAKLKRVYFAVGYPETWPGGQRDSTLRISATDPVGNLQRVANSNYNQALAKLGQPIDRREWSMNAQSPGAVLVFQLNAYNFAAALLQPPKFDRAAADAANYGAIGAIIGHELSHFVDSLGADYDTQGAVRVWWTDADKANYAAASQALIDQFSAYRPMSEVAVDGKQTLIENIADLAGLASAFEAYRLALGPRAANLEALHRMDRQFFIGFARSWRSKLTDEALRAQIAGDGHAPDRYRVATVRNLDAWYEAFDVRPGHKLYLPPDQRVRIW